MLQPQPNNEPQQEPSTELAAALQMSPTAEEAPAPDSGVASDGGITDEDIKKHLDALSDDDKAFLAEHLVPEFVRAIGLISGQEVATYLDKFADKTKVLVPVPREVAEEYLAKQQGQASTTPQGSPQTAPAQAVPAQASPQQAPQMPMQGMMAPR